MTERRLPGGRSFGAVRVGDEVRRPAQPWTATVHSVLRHLEDAGFDGAPRALGFDEQGRERLTFHGDEDQCLEGQAEDAGVKLGVVAGDRSGAFQGAQAAVTRCSGAAMIAIDALLLAEHLLA